MHDIKMQSKGKGKKRDCPVGDNYTECLVFMPLSEMRAAACLAYVAIVAQTVPMALCW